MRVDTHRLQRSSTPQCALRGQRCLSTIVERGHVAASSGRLCSTAAVAQASHAAVAEVAVEVDTKQPRQHVLPRHQRRAAPARNVHHVVLRPGLHDTHHQHQQQQQQQRPLAPHSEATVASEDCIAYAVSATAPTAAAVAPRPGQPQQDEEWHHSLAELHTWQLMNGRGGSSSTSSSSSSSDSSTSGQLDDQRPEAVLSVGHSGHQQPPADVLLHAFSQQQQGAALGEVALAEEQCSTSVADQPGTSWDAGDQWGNAGHWSGSSGAQHHAPGTRISSSSSSSVSTLVVDLVPVTPFVPPTAAGLPLGQQAEQQLQHTDVEERLWQEPEAQLAVPPRRGWSSQEQRQGWRQDAAAGQATTAGGLLFMRVSAQGSLPALARALAHQLLEQQRLVLSAAGERCCLRALQALGQLPGELLAVQQKPPGPGLQQQQQQRGPGFRVRVEVHRNAKPRAYGHTLVYHLHLELVQGGNSQQLQQAMPVATAAADAAAAASAGHAADGRPQAGSVQQRHHHVQQQASLQSEQLGLQHLEGCCCAGEPVHSTVAAAPYGHLQHHSWATTDSRAHLNGKHRAVRSSHNGTGSSSSRTGSGGSASGGLQPPRPGGMLPVLSLQQRRASLQVSSPLQAAVALRTQAAVSAGGVHRPNGRGSSGLATPQEALEHVPSRLAQPDGDFFPSASEGLHCDRHHHHHQQQQQQQQQQDWGLAEAAGQAFASSAAQQQYAHVQRHHSRHVVAVVAGGQQQQQQHQAVIDALPHLQPLRRALPQQQAGQQQVASEVPSVMAVPLASNPSQLASSILEAVQVGQVARVDVAYWKHASRLLQAVAVAQRRLQGTWQQQQQQQAKGAPVGPGSAVGGEQGLQLWEGPPGSRLCLQVQPGRVQRATGDKAGVHVLLYLV